MDKIVIIGGLGTALNIAEAIQSAIANHNHDAEIIGFLNDDLVGSKIGSFSVIDSIQNVSTYINENVKIIFALYRPDKMLERTKLFQSLKIPQEALYSFIHPHAYLSPSVKLGVGNIILSHCSIMNGVDLGNNNIINANVVIEHDTTIGHHNFISAGAVIGSKVSIQSSCFVGLNSSIREESSMQNNSFLGMGSVLLHSIQENEMWYGVPAKKQT